MRVCGPFSLSPRQGLFICHMTRLTTPSGQGLKTGSGPSWQRAVDP